MLPRLQPITIHTESHRRGGGGGGGHHHGEGLLTPLFKFWATRILNRKIDELETRQKQGPLEPKDHTLLGALRQDFNRVTQSSMTAQRVIRDHSAIPFIRHII